MNVELNEDEHKLAAVIECALNFVHTLREPNAQMDAILVVETMHQRGWELTHGLVAASRDAFEGLLSEAHTEIIYLRQQLQEIECRSQS